MSSIDLWPDIDLDAHKNNPIQILKEQAKKISDKTKNLINGEVVTNTEGNVIYNSLYLNVPTLDNYRFALLKIAHTTMQYSLFIYDYSKENEGIKPKRISKPTPFGETMTILSAAMSIDRMYETTEVVIPTPDEKANSPEEFVEMLSKILGSNETKSIINSLIAQVV